MPELYEKSRPSSDGSKQITVLALVRMWCFDNIQEKVVKELDHLALTPSRRLELARIYDIRQWYKPALEDLSRRHSALITSEMDQIGTDLQ